MSQHRKSSQDVTSRKVLSANITDVLAGIRVPDLPYPAARLPANAISEWGPLLQACWREQRDERVTHVIGSVSLDWSVQQVNAAYISDRIMDVFLKTSGLHPELARRIARLRFYLAWRMNLHGADVFSNVFIDWLDSLQEWRGWSDSGGRSSKVLLDQLDALVIAISDSFENGNTEPVETFCQQWHKDASRRNAQVEKLRTRLLETEQGAARQRHADQTARALIGRALQGRMLPTGITRFILDYWHSLLKQVVWDSGMDSENFRHGSRLLEWLVWVGDPSLSDKDRDKLYHVGEQIGDRILDVWQRVFSRQLPAETIAGIQEVIVARLKGEVPELAEALPDSGSFSWDAAWLSITPADAETTRAAEGQWYMEGEDSKEQRMYFFAFLPETVEILWTNGGGVKLGIQPWHEFHSAHTNGHLLPLPTLTPFRQVLDDTVNLLAAVCQKQRKQRDAAAQQAKHKAEVLRKENETAERIRKEKEVAREAELKRQRDMAEQLRLASEQAEEDRLLKEKELIAQKQTDGIKLGSWIVVAPESAEDEPLRLKLAVRISSSRKLVFVDRLGLNRREFLEDQLVEGIVDGRVRVLDSSAEFDDVLSRVVGRIRIGKN
jgi:hypothetical protein